MYTNKPEKALYRMGQKVKSDYYPGITFKVASKSWGYDNCVRYTLAAPEPLLPMTEYTICNVRQKDISL